MLQVLLWAPHRPACRTHSQYLCASEWEKWESPLPKWHPVWEVVYQQTHSAQPNRCFWDHWVPRRRPFQQSHGNKKASHLFLDVESYPVSLGCRFQASLISVTSWESVYKIGKRKPSLGLFKWLAWDQMINWFFFILVNIYHCIWPYDLMLFPYVCTQALTKSITSLVTCLLNLYHLSITLSFSFTCLWPSQMREKAVLVIFNLAFFSIYFFIVFSVIFCVLSTWPFSTFFIPALERKEYFL